MTNSEIQEVVSRVLVPELGPRGLDHIEVRSENDEVDGPALFVDAFMKPDANAVGGGVASSALHALNIALLDAGEVRFPYLRLHYLGEDNGDGGSLGSA